MAIVAEHFTPLNLTSIQFAALVAINDSPGLDATRLAALIDYDRPTMTGVIDRLEAKGLVERVPDPNDGRSVQVVLSTTGRGRVDDALTDLLAHERAILAALPPSDQDQLADLLRSLTLPFDTAAD